MSPDPWGLRRGSSRTPSSLSSESVQYSPTATEPIYPARPNNERSRHPRPSAVPPAIGGTIQLAICGAEDGRSGPRTPDGCTRMPCDNVSQRIQKVTLSAPKARGPRCAGGRRPAKPTRDRPRQLAVGHDFLGNECGTPALRVGSAQACVFAVQPGLLVIRRGTRLDDHLGSFNTRTASEPALPQVRGGSERRADGILILRP